MPNENRKFSERLVSKTKVYLVIIAILLIILFVYNHNLIIPGTIFFILIVIYSYWTTNKKNAELSKHIQDLTLTMDSAAKKTLINSPFPLVIVETDGSVIWKSSKFVYEFANIDINTYLNEVIKELKQDIESRKDERNKSIEKKITINNRVYKILGEYVKSKQESKKNTNEYMSILYFIDITENIKIEQKYKDSQSCIGLIIIDNYEEIMQRISAEEKPQIMAKIEKLIYEWASQTNGVVVKSDRDTFVYTFEQRYLEWFKENKFDILDRIKSIPIEGRFQLTLSIAISNEGESLYEKYKSALSSMDIVLGRGGDQAVIRKDKKYTFFGGRVEEIEKRTKVKARITAHALEELMNDSKDVFVMGHMNGDIDSMGSSLGIYRLAKSLGKDAYIVNDTFGLSLQSFMEALYKEEEYRDNILDKTVALNKISQDSLLVIVDTHKVTYVEVPELLEKTSKIVVIDHHRRSTDYINSMLTFQEVYASSAAELVTEIIQYAEKEVTLKNIEVEGLYAGIMMDTKNFTFKTGVRTFEAAAYLRRCGVDIIKVKKWFQSDLRSYNQISDIVKVAEIINKTIAIAIYDKEDKDSGVICAKAADELLTIADITASFVMGKVGEKVFISGRSIGDINVQVILEKLGGGGHITLAGAQVEGMTLEEVKQELINRINEYFSEISS